MKKLIAITFFIFLASAVCCAQYSFSGRLVNEQQEPLAGATVALAKGDALAITDSLGNYHFSYTNTSAELVFSHVGYQSLVMRLKTGQATHVILLHSNDLLTETIFRAFEKNSAAKNVSASITVLGKRTLERYNNQSFVAAMNNEPGVRMDERSPGSYRLSIRGNLLRSAFGVRNVKVYWDGIPFTDANGNTYVNELAFDNIGKMEIIKGPSGSMYGAGTGGVLLLTGNAASVKGKELSLQLSGGSYGLFSAGASYTQVSSKANASYGFSHQQQDGYRNHTNLRRDVANYSGIFTLSNRQKITAHLFYADHFVVVDYKVLIHIIYDILFK